MSLTLSDRDLSLRDYGEFLRENSERTCKDTLESLRVESKRAFMGEANPGRFSRNSRTLTGH